MCLSTITKVYWKGGIKTKKLFSGSESVHIVKNCDLRLEIAAWSCRLWAALSIDLYLSHIFPLHWPPSLQMYKLENWSQRLAQQDALALTCKMTCVYVYMHNVQGREECSCKHVSNSSFTALSIFTTVSQTKSCKEFYMGDQELENTMVPLTSFKILRCMTKCYNVHLQPVILKVSIITWFFQQCF